MNDIPSARYVDDIYLAFKTEAEAQKGLVQLIERLRKNGLHLNEYKSGIFPAKSIVHEETEMDRIFQTIRDEMEGGSDESILSGYGFEADWEIYDDDDNDNLGDEQNEDDRDTSAAIQLFQSIDEYQKQADKIEKFCLPLLRAADSDVAIDYVLQNLLVKPHMTRLYYSYLSGFVSGNQSLVRDLEKVAKDKNLVSDYQKMFLLAALISAQAVSEKMINISIKWLENAQVARESRAVAAIFAAKHGKATQKRAVRLSYENEPSSYVRSAILYASSPSYS